ncbi:helix-turn-helix transcriptional regulator [Halobacteria archaeon AArc-curdl1]|uniref:Helix-turn-helix transcriptional regulator n=1 Tax=Natronosalvus hydrolyticus TaxID=2979988 RepID=A0AAP2Z6S8_9EURY|nr:helix-turn-helix transcriptional regulator [Halobacteria archaeon AArc-curdl1]
MAQPNSVSDALEALLEAPSEDALEAADQVDSDLETEESPDLLELLERRHALSVLRAVATTPDSRRFSELEEEIGAAPSTLSARLSEFTGAGLLERESYDEMPPRVEYRPTEAAMALAPLFTYLRLWESRYGDDL